MDPDPQAGVQVGMRVVRGVDWKWGQQDGGEGGVGMVVELGRHGSPSTPDRTVVVQWDQGTRTNYRVGYQGAHDQPLESGEGALLKVVMPHRT
uniref:MIB/HERC2 domain-containing protein n=1 Tax=Saimiri boliviensis boliviensis TaxID=39432 RepID=A0A2K6SFD8_SAIBB